MYLFAWFLVVSLAIATCKASCGESDLCDSAEECLVLLADDSSAECESFPVPFSALPKVIRPAGYNLTRLAAGVYVYHDGSYFSLLARSESEVVVVDFPGNSGTVKADGSGTRITDALEEIMDDAVPQKITMVYTHAHLDHVGSKEMFPLV